ncbi:MAG TPA: hypothetical protein VLY63_20200 [Anaerolineae bacterium]|nr:hypothetical protein [Anaerolineae bacterium]
MPGDLGHFKQRLEAGLARLRTFQHKSGLFSIWCGGKEGVDITARVAHRLLGFEGLPFGDAFDMRSKAADALRKHSYKNNQLLPLGGEFRAPLETVADAVALYFHGDGHRDEALDYLRRTAERLDDGTACWPTSRRHYWGGQLEATCDAARVVLHAGDALFVPAFRYVTGKLVDGMLYSTADTRALVELLAGLGFRATDTALIDGREMPLQQVSVGKEVTARTDNLIVRVDEQIEIDHLEPRADFRFGVKPSKKRLKLGERIQITVTPKESTIAPLVRLYLPGCLALLKGGANAQTAHLPVEQDDLVVDAVAVRPGRGKLYVTVHDMYDADKIGTAPGIEIRVK